MKLRVASEFSEQAALIQWWTLACKGYGLPEFSLYAVPNGAHLAGDARSRAIKMANLKRAGLRPGMLDLNLDVPIQRNDPTIYPGLRIEMKCKPNKPSHEQAEVIVYLRSRGYVVHVCYSFEEAKAAIERYLR